MKTIGIFEAKTKLSEICEDVAQSGIPVVVTRRGTALVSIEPIVKKQATIRERRSDYLSRHGASETIDEEDFQPATRSREKMDFRIEE